MMEEASTGSGKMPSESALAASRVLAMNRGSSTLKVSLYSFGPGDSATLLLTGKVDRIGQPQATLYVNDLATGQQSTMEVDAPGHGEAAGHLLDWLHQRFSVGEITAVGHRVVHGGQRYAQPERISAELLEELRRISPFDPDHLPMEIAMIEAVTRRSPSLPQVACFDTAFHRQMPRVARLLPIPRKYDRMGIERYGFHGLSYAYLMEELARTAGSAAAGGRVILAHFGAGASMAAVRDGRSIDTSMSFTPTAGLPMATRAGDLDPGLVSFLARSEHMSVEEFHELVNRRCGLLGVSETSGDVRDLLAREATDVRAAEALALFCYQAKKWIGAFTVVLGGLDTLVFAGGIGEHAAEIRSRICDGLQFLGVELDPARNGRHEFVISADASRVAVHVIATNEELMVAKATHRIVSGTSPHS
jgi:acetate kinase